MLLRLFIAPLWSPAGKGLTFKALVGDFYCIFFTFSCGVVGQVWYLLVLQLFSDPCLFFTLS